MCHYSNRTKTESNREMAASKELIEAFPMKSGDGPNSYAKNSTYQRQLVDAGKEILSKTIAEKLDVEILLSSSSTFRVADLGCSVGPNTFSAVENILEAVEFKYQSRGLSSQIPAGFQVFFNDHTSNDFNMLFRSLPPNRRYCAAGVPGSFHGRLFPNASIHFFHSSFTIHWMSRVPKEVADKNSPAWNKGRIHYLNSTDEVVRAYEAQHAEDMECFLHARAQEIVHGGLMALTIPGLPSLPHETSHPRAARNGTHQLVESCLTEMVRKGMVSEEKVDSFNVPIYYMSLEELEAAVERNGCFSVERIENLPFPQGSGSISKLIISHIRAAIEGLIKQHFGHEILDELFDLCCKKFEEQRLEYESGRLIIYLAVLKRKAN
ncbi:loganic acid O-methyltransferase-like [Pyrus x bretschneideri]|uniref:loganic acid O-methyltransferase-like n=1 Tax=Pyrus x bretschneideri TaxID=225117 RepID=UPI0020302DEA|nr:loganic acid O-methyltransferase-like [Pyrus x bretschneideri]